MPAVLVPLESVAAILVTLSFFDIVSLTSYSLSSSTLDIRVESLEEEPSIVTVTSSSRSYVFLLSSDFFILIVDLLIDTSSPLAVLEVEDAFFLATILETSLSLLRVIVAVHVVSDTADLSLLYVDDEPSSVTLISSVSSGRL